MKYTPQEVMQYIEEEDVKFIRLAFCDVHGKPKNISIMPQELERAFRYGIAVDASAIAGFGDEVHSDLFLHPDRNSLYQAVPQMIFQNHFPGVVQCRTNRCQLNQHISAVLSGFHHPFYLFQMTNCPG